MDLRVDGEGGFVHRTGPANKLAAVIDKDEIRGLDVAKVHAEGVHPE